MFPQIPADLTKLTDDELTAALNAHLDVVRTITASAAAEPDPEALEKVTAEFGEDGSAVIAALTAGVEDVERIKAEMAAREEGKQEFNDRVAQLTAGLAEDVAETPEPEATETEVETPVEVEAETVAEAAVEVVAEAEAVTAEAVVEAEPVLAAAETRIVLPKTPKRQEPLPQAESAKFPVVAAAGVHGFSEGQPLDRLGVATAMIERRRRISATKGVSEQVVVASAKWDYPPERILDPHDTYEVTQRKLDAVVSEDAIVASGGLCAPVTPYYELANVSVPDRPVRDSLAAFQAVRGGLNFAAPPVLGDVTTAISYITEAEDQQGGTFATKSCQVVDCPSFSEVDVAIIAHCVQFGNLGARAFPEQVAQFNDLVMAAHARVAETALLDGIAAASTAVTAATATYGYAGTGGLLGEILTAAAGIRSRNRMSRDARLRIILPEWVTSWLVSDLVNSQFVRFEYSIAGVVELLRTLVGVEPTFTKDGATGAAQVYGAQAAGALLTFPGTIVWYIFPEGSYLFLDGGELELGIVRDSVLNATNDFQIFGETFENIAYVGVESLAVTSTICPAGSTGGPDTLITC